MSTMPLSLFETFVRSLRHAVKKSGISQQELARRSGVHFVTINRLLNGTLENTTFELAEKLLDAARADKSVIRQKIG